MAFLAPALPFIAAAGTLFGGVAGFEQSRYQAQVARNNADIAAKNAQRAADAGQIEAQRSDLEYAQQEAQALSIQSASGLDVLGRTQLATRDNIARVRDIAAHDIRLQSDENVQKLLQDSANFKGQASAAKLEGITKLVGSIGDAGTSLLGSSRSTRKSIR